jgi:hypothetical protein
MNILQYNVWWKSTKTEFTKEANSEESKKMTKKNSAFKAHSSQLFPMLEK